TGQWCVYPDLKGSGKETDFLKEKNLEIFRDFAETGGVLKYSKQFHESSGAFQVLLYKQEIEMMLRTPGAAGFQLLGLEDYPGHGFAPVGIVDAYGNEKTYISPDEFRQFCGPVIPLALIERRVWQNNEIFRAEIKVANYGGEDIPNPVLIWEIADNDGKQRARGTIENKLIPNGGLVFLDSIQLDLDSFSNAQKLQLTLGLSNPTVKNHWDFWVYPSDNALQDVKDILIFRQLDESMLKAIDSGKKILFIPEKNAVKAHNPGSFESIFWSTWSGTGTLGIHCEDSHPSLSEFPTENHTNWQWWELLRTSLPLDLTGIELQEDPVVQVIDNWIRARKLGILFEFSIGESKILVCAMDIENNPEERFVARQLRNSLIKYLDSKDFKPKSEITLEDFESILGTNLKGIAAMGATVFTNQEFPPNLASNIADGDESSYWEAGIVPEDYFELVIELPGYVTLDGLRLIPFGAGHDAPRISYDIFLSNDGTEWDYPVYEGFYPPNDEKDRTIRFSATQNARFIKIQFCDENGSVVPYVSLAELELILNESVNQ
ncbi:MAG: discoidin domain-containing protein, partial [Bacteroidales bacterium]|nr:discoidin domain-containing protein [Bacteroidales bacterium]